MWTKSNIPDQTGKTIIVTGANTGIGYETALALYEAGAHVVLEPWQGALCLLYAAVSPNALGGSLYEPDQGGFRGYPTLSTIKENALDEATATKLWDVAEEVTGVVYLQ